VKYPKVPDDSENQKNKMTKPSLVGGGSVGMTIASELARYGVFLFASSTGGPSGPTNRKLWFCGAGRWNRWIAAEEQARSSMLGSRPKRLASLRATSYWPVSMESVQSPYPYALMLTQSEIERLLKERLGSLGVRVE
jgi:hypothetical protein